MKDWLNHRATVKVSVEEVARVLGQALAARAAPLRLTEGQRGAIVAGRAAHSPT